MMQCLYRDFWLSGPTSATRCEIVCAVLLGFFFLLRISAIEQCTWANITLGKDRGDDDISTWILPKSKTDQFNAGDVKPLKTLKKALCPVSMGGGGGMAPDVS